jgi:hypothetical protein
MIYSLQKKNCFHIHLTGCRRSNARSVVKIGNPCPFLFAYLLVNNDPRSGNNRFGFSI